MRRSLSLFVTLLLGGVVRASCPPSISWSQNWDGTEAFADRAMAVAGNPSGSAYVAGWSNRSSGGVNWEVAKYDGAGNRVWSVGHDGPSAGDDRAQAVAADGTSVYVAGFEDQSGAGQGLDWLLKVYDAGGGQVSSTQWNGEAYGDDRAMGVAVSPSGLIAVVGSGNDLAGGLNWRIRVYDRDLNLLWERFYDNPFNFSDYAAAAAFTPVGQLVVGGEVEYSESGGTTWDWRIHVYDPDGTTRFTAEVDDTVEKYLVGVAVDASGSIYAAGYENHPGQGYDIVVRKYAPTLGAALWTAVYNDASNLNDYATGITVLSDGRVVVSGFEDNSPASNSFDWIALGYNDAGVERWAVRHASPDDSNSMDDRANGVAAVGPGRFVVAGYESRWATDNDWRVIGYLAPPACLASGVWAEPAAACPGTPFRLVLTVTNEGDGAATGVTATLNIDSGEGLLTLLSVDAGPATLPAGGVRTFTWEYTAAGTGSLAFTGTASGVDQLTSLPLLTVSTSGSEVLTPATLESALAASGTVFGGDPLEVVLTVTNTGAFAADNVDATVWMDAGSSLVAVTSGPAPGPYSIPAGGSSYFTWIFSTVPDGVVSFTGTAAGEDSCGGGLIAASASCSATVVGPARLVSAASISSSVVALGQIVSVVLTVTNTGGVDAVNVSATCWPETNPASVGWFSTFPGPSSIPPGGSADYAWLFWTVASGQVRFTATAAGEDVKTAAAMSTSSWADLTVLGSAQFCATLFVTPVVAVAGQQVTAVAMVSHCGSASSVGARKVGPYTPPIGTCPIPAALGWAAGGSATLGLASEPAPSCAMLWPGQSAAFTWVFTAGGSGTVDLAVTMTGEEDISGTARTTWAGRSITVQPSAALDASLDLAPSCAPSCTVHFDDILTVRLTVSNTADSAAGGVRPLTQTLTGTARLSLVSGPAAGGVSIPGLGVTSFEWTYRVTASGTLTIASAAVGRDEATLVPIASNESSLWMRVPLPSRLQVEVTGPSGLVQGQEAVFNLRITNLSVTVVTQSAVAVLWNGSASGVGVVSTDPLLPRSYQKGEVREFRVRVRVDQGAPIGTGNLAFQAVAHEEYTGWGVDTAGGTWPAEIVAAGNGLTRVLEAAPNPFHPYKAPDLVVRYAVTPGEDGKPVSLRLYSLSGELVRELAAGTPPAGVHTVRWDGHVAGGRRAASGIYLLVMKTFSTRRVMKIAVIK